MKQQLTTYLSENGLFSESQFANRRQRSTEDAVVLASNIWLTAKTKREYTEWLWLICGRRLTG